MERRADPFSILGSHRARRPSSASSDHHMGLPRLHSRVRSPPSERSNKRARTDARMTSMEPPPLLESILSGSAEVEGCIAALLKCPKQRGLGPPPLLPFTAFALSFTQRTCFLLFIPKRALAPTSCLTLMARCVRAFPPASRRGARMRAFLSSIPASPPAAGKPLGNSYR